MIFFINLLVLGKEDYFHNKVRSAALENADNQVKSSIITTSSRYLLEFLLVLFVVSLVVSSVIFGEDLNVLVPTLGIFGVASLRLMPLANLFSNTLTRLRYSRHAISLLHADLLTFRKTNQIRKLQRSLRVHCDNENHNENSWRALG